MVVIGPETSHNYQVFFEIALGDFSSLEQNLKR